MGRFAVLLLLLTGCSGLFGLDTPVRLDADAADAPSGDGSADSATNCFGHLPICVTTAVADRSFSTKTINTNADCDVTIDQAASQPQLCVLLGRGILVTGTLKAVGARPLVIVATETLSITGTGSIDVASRNNQTPAAAASYPGCTGNDGTNTSGADAGGGAGGSFSGAGGDGGNGDVAGGAAGPALVSPPTFVRGGCKGWKGGIASGAIAYDGGDSGGAVYLVAGARIDVTGNINASGGGGKGGAIGGNGNCGGSGGGSGGMIRLDAPMVSITGDVYANGGGGGGASGALPGPTGATSADPTQGGSAGGNGGVGSAGSNLAGAIGTSAASGGGGGGGGAGFVEVLATQSTLSGRISPPAIMM